MDLIYFGYYDDESLKLKDLFKQNVMKEFPDVILVDADDDIKGLRYELHYDKKYEEKEIMKWLLKDGWLNNSLTLQIMTMDNDKSFNFKDLYR